VNNGIVLLSVSLDGHLGSLGIGHDRVRRDSDKACFNSWSYVEAKSQQSRNSPCRS
jgi:hypothetical protein